MPCVMMALQVLHTCLPTSGRSLPPWPQFPHLHSQGLELPDLERPLQSQHILVKKEERREERTGREERRRGKKRKKGGEWAMQRPRGQTSPTIPWLGK